MFIRRTKIWAWALVVVLLAAIGVGSSGSADLQVTRHDLRTSPQAAAFRVVQLSDLHLQRFGSTEQAITAQVQDLQGREWPLRMHVWHRVNDERLQTGRTAFTAPEMANLLALLQGIQSGEENSPLLRAEILRELGRFGEAAQALDCEVDEHETARAEQILNAIARGDDQPFVFESGQNRGGV